MKLREFIKELEKIEKKYGEEVGVVMADYRPVVEPVLLSDKYLGDNVVITDEQ